MKHGLSFRHIIVIIICLFSLVGCNKDSTKSEEMVQNINEYGFVSYTIDLPTTNQSDLNIISSWDGHCINSSDSLQFIQCDIPQLIVVTDANNRIRMLYRGILSNGTNISLNAHNSALAMTLCNPIVSMIGDSNFSSVVSLIESLQSFPSFEAMVAQQIEAGNDLFDTNNRQLLNCMQAVFDELLSAEIDTNSMKGVDPWACVDHFPIKCEYVSNNDPSVVWLSNYSLCPTFYGSLTGGGHTKNLIIPSIGSYTLTNTVINLAVGNSPIYGEKVYVGLNKGEDNRIYLTNLHCQQAKVNIGAQYVSDFMTILPLPLPENLKTSISTKIGQIVADAVVSITEDNEPSIRAAVASIQRSVISVLQEEILKALTEGVLRQYFTQYSEQYIRNIIGKIFTLYNAIVGSGNAGSRTYYLIKYPNDISICLHHGYDTHIQNYYVESCGLDYPNCQDFSIHKFPYTQDFENELGCWTYEGWDGFNSSGYIYGISGAHSGVCMAVLNAFYNEETVGSRSSNLLSPLIDLRGNTAKLTFYVRGNSNRITVISARSNGDINSYNVFYSQPNWQFKKYDLASNTAYIWILCESDDSETRTTYIDDISIKLNNH